MSPKKILLIIPSLLLAIALWLSIVEKDAFVALTSSMNAWILSSFGDLFSLTAFFCFLLVLAIYLSPLRKTIIGGPDARPLLTRFSWFTITLCTTIAVGILFWATAEPLYHLYHPPVSVGFESGSKQAAQFALSTLFMHWTFIPYSIYAIGALVFAISYYTRKEPYQIGSMLSPLLGSHLAAKVSPLVDGLSLFSVMVGMAASLGAALLILSGGATLMLGVAHSAMLTGVIALVLVSIFTASASSGLLKGIKWLSHVNFLGFGLLLVWLIVWGPLDQVYQQSVPAMGYFIQHFFQQSLAIGYDEQWSHTWTIFYWANWMAWMPVTALFLGRLGVGYSVKTFIEMNFWFPALFSLLWMAILGSFSLYYDQQTSSGALYALMVDQGPEIIVFTILQRFPLSQIIIPLYVLLIVVSFVTAADSNTSAMSGLSTHGIQPDQPEAGWKLKSFFGLLIGITAWMMVETSGIDGIKMLSNLGGLPAMLLILGILGGGTKLLWTAYQKG